MTLQTCPRIFWPSPHYASSTFTTLSTLDAAGEYSSWIGQATEAMTISHVGISPGTIAGSGSVDLRIETVDATTGFGTGTLWAANTNIVTGALTSNTWAVFALTASASISAGQVFCLKAIYASGTSVIIRSIPADEIMCAFPYKAVNTGTPTLSSLAETIALGVASSSTAFYNMFGLMPASAVGNNAFNNTNSAKRGLRFQVPFKCRCVGMWHANSGSTLGDLNALIENDAGTEQSSSSTAIDGDFTGAAVATVRHYYFDNAVTLSPATWYRAVVEPTSATNITVYTVTAASAAILSGTPWGTNAHYFTFASAAYDDTNTNQIPRMGIIIDQLDDGVSAGSTTGGGTTFGFA